MEQTAQQQKALEIIYQAADEVNDMLAEDRKLDKSPETILTGDEGKLDSLGLVSFIVAVEGAAQRELGADLALADQVESPDSPLKTMATLAQYIAETGGN